MSYNALSGPRPPQQQQQQQHHHQQPQSSSRRPPLPTPPAPRTFSPTPASPLSPRTMPSPRTSPAMRPTSPRSPGFKQSAHFDALQPPPMHSRTSGNQRRTSNNSLKLPSLPRFHPANFPSAHSSTQTTPDGTGSPHPPVSPRAYQRIYSDAQKQLYFNQREMRSAAVRSAPNQNGKPVSPRLEPLGSPGPVTPLELEGEQEYLLAGARNAGSNVGAQELVDHLIREETRRQRNMAPAAGRPTSR